MLQCVNYEVLFFGCRRVSRYAKEQNVNDKISQIVADLFNPPKPGENWAVRMQLFRDEVRKIAERDQTTFGTFLGLLESFRTVIPDEKQRYHAAIQAMSATAKLNKDGLLTAIADQLAELAAIEKDLMPVIPEQRNQLTGWDARAKVIRNEITQMRDRIAQLENEEKGIVTYIAARQQELDYVEKSMQLVFAAVGSDITAVKDKILEYTAETAPVQQPVQAAAEAAPQPAAQPAEQPAADAPPEPREAAGQAIEIAEPPALDPKFQKPCPMCGGVMNFQMMDDAWICYACAHEESGSSAVSGADRVPSDKDRVPAKGQEAGPGIWPGESSTPKEDQWRRENLSQDQPPKKSSEAKAWTRKETCPVCRMTMLWFPDNKVWRCRSCNYERRV
jgi:hypothetical protein